MFFESHHPKSVDYYKILSGENISFPAHMHDCYEMILVPEGSLAVDVNQQSYTVDAGEGVLIFPNQVHWIHTEAYNRYVLCLFNHRLINSYHMNVADKLPASNKFRCDPFYMEKMKALPAEGAVLAVKGILYSLCYEFDRDRRYLAFEKSPHHLLSSIFQFIEQNYRKSCSLAELSKSLGYDYHYLSSYFRKNTGMLYGEYVNQVRINCACYLLRESDMPVMAVSKECGYGSHRTFVRNFREQTGQSPAEYRKTERA